MSTYFKMFLLAIFAVVLVMAAGCFKGELYSPGVARCESPYYNGPFKTGGTTVQGTYLLLEDGTALSYPPSVRCEPEYK